MKIKCSVMDLCGHFGQLAQWGQWASDLVGESQDQKNKKCVRLWTMHTFSMAFLITKTGSSLPWWSLCTRAVLLLFEEIPVAHTGFPIHIPQGFLKRNPVSFLKVSKKNSMSTIPNCLLRRHTKACSPVSWRSRTKTKQQNGARSDYFFLQSTKLNSTTTMKRHRIYDTYVAYKVNTIRLFTGPAQTSFHKGHSGSQHNFSPEADGQKQDTLVLPPLLESNCLSLMFH